MIVDIYYSIMYIDHTSCYIFYDTTHIYIYEVIAFFHTKSMYLEVQGAFTNPVLENYLPDSTHHILLDSSKISTLGSQQKQYNKNVQEFPWI